MAKKKPETKKSTKKATKKSAKKSEPKAAAPEVKDDLEGTEAERAARAKEAEEEAKAKEAEEEAKSQETQEDSKEPEQVVHPLSEHPLADQVLDFVKRSEERFKGSKTKSSLSSMETTLKGHKVKVRISVEAA
jgi:hypothetical protein